MNILSFVEVEPDGETDQLRWRQAFYRGTDLMNLTRFTEGPWGMKDIRITQLKDGRIYVATRPQGTFRVYDENGNWISEKRYSYINTKSGKLKRKKLDMVKTREIKYNE